MGVMNESFGTDTNIPAGLVWDESQKRWRGVYRGVRLTISAIKLGGTNASDTKKAAMNWFKQKQAERDSR